MAVVKLLFQISVGLLITAGLVTFIPGIPPHYPLTSFHIQPPRKFDGWFASNRILDEAEIYYESSSVGIESLAVLGDDTIITSDQSGRVFKITGKQKADTITHLKFECFPFPPVPRSLVDKDCGWPLGMRLDKTGGDALFLMDIFGGLVKVNTSSGSYESLVARNTKIGNKGMYIPEDVDFTRDGTIYFTDACTNDDFFAEMMGQPSGRLIKYDPITKTNEVLLSDLHFANGIAVSDDENFLIVAEMDSSRIRRYYLKGENKGKSDVFVDGLPGYPDNIRPNAKGDGFYVALWASWNEDFSFGIHIYSPYPTLRKFLLRSRFLLLCAINIVKSVFPDNVYLATIENEVASFGPLLNFAKSPKAAAIVELSKRGEIIGIFNGGNNGPVYNPSQLSAGKKYGYLANPFTNKVWRLKLDALMGHHHQHQKESSE